MKKRTLTAGTIFLCLSAISFGQNSIKDFLHQNPQFFGSTASVYYCNDTTDTPAPKDFIPFHIDHIARHGSRTHDSKSMVPNLYKLMNKADSLNLLTREGKLLRNQIDTIYHLMNHRWGDLTPLGARQPGYGSSHVSPLSSGVYTSGRQSDPCGTIDHGSTLHG